MSDEFRDEYYNSHDRLQDQNKRLVKCVDAIRKSDCGAWLKDCETHLFHCSEGHEKRMELSKLLNDLYKARALLKEINDE